MASTSPHLSPIELERFKSCPVECPRLRDRVSSLADYFAIISSAVGAHAPFWFRGHPESRYSLTPSALRYRTASQRSQALQLMPEFKRIADIKLHRPPSFDNDLMWSQIAQHYGLPTRLLDWTENATAALYFACQKSDCDGIAFLLNPIELNRLSYPLKPRVLDPEQDRGLILKYLNSGVRDMRRGSLPLAINPVWNSDRLMIQKGKLTLHGNRFTLDRGKIPSLVAILILREVKETLLSELERVGIDEMTLFPELEHSCIHLKRHARLELV
jgi:FRG domain